MENKHAPSPEQASEIKEGFFLRRPIFSTVISLIITLVGAIAISVLPIEQYPDLTPPQVEVSASYTGASARRRRNRGFAARKPDQRRRQHDLHEFGQLRDRKHEPDRVFQCGH